MCEKCPIDQRYPYYGFPVTPDSHKLRDEAERYREIAIRCFVAESDCADVKRADALWREMCRAVAVAVVHGRAWPSCVWPWCRVRRGRGRGRRALDVAASWP